MDFLSIAMQVFVLALIVSTECLNIQRKVAIIQASDTETFIGVIHGRRSCGGPAHVLQWRFDTCVGEQTPCQIPADDVIRRAELDIAPNKDISGLGIELAIVENGVAIGTTVFETGIPNSAVKGGENYTVIDTGSIREEYKGKTITIRETIFDLENKAVEACVEAEFEII